MTSDDFGLTARDLDMLQGLADGVTTNEMAERRIEELEGLLAKERERRQWAEDIATRRGA